LVTVEYPHQFSYREMFEGQSPVLLVTISRLDGADDAIDVEAYIDSGTSTSLFNGFVLSQLGLDLMNDKKKVFESTVGSSVEAYLHRVRLALPSVGVFDLEIAFSNAQITRNLLGRDFFNLVQIGFRERRLEYYLNNRP
jgi:hypothetical protein